MSIATNTIYDVFITHGARDRGIADLVGRALADAGLEVYAIHESQPDEDELSEMRTELAGCSAFVVILTQSTVKSPNVAFEIGMALAWNKPVFVLYDGISKSDIPNYLRSYRVASISKLSQVVREIKKVQQPLSDSDRETLVEVYCDLAVATDKLLGRPLLVRQLAEDFNGRTKSAVGGEKLVQELIRLRKQGKLPKLKRR